MLDPSAKGALSASGNANINVAGGVYVDSSASNALSASGNAVIKALVIDVHGGVSKSGNASLSPTPVTGAATLADALSGLAEPSTSGLTNYGSESISTSNVTVNPGIYSQITVSGSAVVTMKAGIYIIEGGGLSVSGNAGISGSGVIIFNVGSKYPNTGGSYGSITLGGNGSESLTPPTTGPYAGILFYQPHDNSKTLTFSGNSISMSGAIYASAAQLSESGNSQLNAALVLDQLTISANGIANAKSQSSKTGVVDAPAAQVSAAYGVGAAGALGSSSGQSASRPAVFDQYVAVAGSLNVARQYGQGASPPPDRLNTSASNPAFSVEAADRENEPIPIMAARHGLLVSDSMLDDLVSELVRLRGQAADQAYDGIVGPLADSMGVQSEHDEARGSGPSLDEHLAGPMPRPQARRQPSGWLAVLPNLVLFAGLCDPPKGRLDGRRPLRGRVHFRREFLKFMPRRRLGCWR